MERDRLGLFRFYALLALIIIFIPFSCSKLKVMNQYGFFATPSYLDFSKKGKTMQIVRFSQNTHLWSEFASGIKIILFHLK